MTLASSTQFNSYLIGEPIGAGGMGEGQQRGRSNLIGNYSCRFKLFRVIKLLRPLCFEERKRLVSVEPSR